MIRRILAWLTPEPTWENATALLGALLLLIGTSFVAGLVSVVVVLLGVVP